MERREFLKKSGSGAAVGAAIAGGAAPAIAQSGTRWRMATSWPKSLDTLFGAADDFAKRVTSLTEGKLTVTAAAAGELVPALQVLDAVQNNTVEMCSTLSSYFFGKYPWLAFDAGMAFGLNVRQQNAWLYHGGGLQLIRDLCRPLGVYPMPHAHVGVQMGGWYRKEIKTTEDLKGLKFRIGGFGGLVLSKLGVVPQQIPTGEIYASLERGTVDAAEWIGPYDDEKLGLNKVARFYYYPGWWEGSAMLTCFINLKAWEALPKSQQDAIEAANNEQMLLAVAKYDAQNPAALKRLVGGGAQLRAFSRPVMDACYKATQETIDELAAKNEDFKKVYESWRRFRDDQNLWFRVAENSLDAYRYSIAAR